MDFIKLEISSLTKAQLRRMEEMEKTCGLEPFSRRMLLESVANMDTFAMLDGEQIMGFITVHPSMRYFEDSVYIVNLNVAREYRRKGVATRLILGGCSAYAKTHGEKQVTLDVRKDNYVALALYHKLGFSVTDEQSGNGETDVVMAISMKELLGIVSTHRVMLRRMTALDTAEGIRILRDERVNRTYMVPDLTLDAAQKLYDRFCVLSADNTRYIRGIYLDNRLIGFLNDQEITDGSIELGWVVDPEYQNQGFASEAVSCAIQDLFAMDFTEVTAGAFLDNPASIRVMEKCGMQRINKTEEIEYRGKTHHCVFFAIRRSL